MFVRGGKFYGQEGRLTHDYQALPKTISHGLVPVLSIGGVDKGGHRFQVEFCPICPELFNISTRVLEDGT